MLLPEHCLAASAAVDAFGQKLEVEACVSHPEASLGTGTDFAFCAIKGPHPTPMTIGELPKPTTPTFLVQRRNDSFRTYPVEVGGGTASDLVYRVPPDAFCHGDSGAPIVVRTGGRTTMVAMASARERGADCHSQGTLHAIPAAEALAWKASQP